jgi:hypothetical protein|tara:strand:+ start:737 stop:1240 length:504 start_codon:yes stop_codon:yes gene_type:complete
MLKKVLSEQSLIYGDVSMPKGFEINSLELVKSIFDSLYNKQRFTFCRSWSKLDSYIRDFSRVKFKLNLICKDTWGSVYIPNEKTESLINVNPNNLSDSADFTLLYGINTKDCEVRIFYDNNRIKGCSWNMQLKNNMFVMFPSTNMYSIENKQKDSLNFIQTITYINT